MRINRERDQPSETMSVPEFSSECIVLVTERNLCAACLTSDEARSIFVWMLESGGQFVSVKIVVGNVGTFFPFSRIATSGKRDQMENEIGIKRPTKEIVVQEEEE